MIWLQRPPGVDSFSSTVTSYPFFASRAAVAIPPMPAPITSAVSAVCFINSPMDVGESVNQHLVTLYGLLNICQCIYKCIFAKPLQIKETPYNKLNTIYGGSYASTS